MTKKEQDAYLNDSYGLRNTVISAILAKNALDKPTFSIEPRDRSDLFLEIIKLITSLYDKYFQKQEDFYSILYLTPPKISA